MKTIPFYIVDVFAEERFQGNQLAVFDCRQAEDISTQEMLSITREINFAESTFYFGGNQADGYQVRIFTPEYELPFAGHPTLGTSYCINEFFEKEKSSSFDLNLKAGKIPVSFKDKGIFMRQNEPEFLDRFSKNEIGDLFKIDNNSFGDLPIEEISTGIPFIIIPLKNNDALENLQLDINKVKEFLIHKKKYKTVSNSGLTSMFFFYTEQTIHPENQYHARMFMIENNMLVEDAATGSANGCFLSYLLKNVSSSITAKVEQGYEMNRPSLLFIEGLKTDQKYQINVGGNTQFVAKGEWQIM